MKKTVTGKTNQLTPPPPIMISDFDKGWMPSTLNPGRPSYLRSYLRYALNSKPPQNYREAKGFGSG